MAYKCFDVAVADGVAHVRLNRPAALNALNWDFFSELPEILFDIDDNARARVIVLSSTGKHFCVGMDLSLFDASETISRDPAVDELGRQREAFRDNLVRTQGVFTALEEIRIPVIAAVQGACVGGGLDLVAACDFRYATDSAFFCIQEINIGAPPDLGTFPRLCRLLPEGLVRELAYTGRRLSAEKALANGFVNEVFQAEDDMVAAALETAREIAAHSPLALLGSKHFMNYARDHTTAESLDRVALWMAAMAHGEDIRVAITARAEKKTPVFADLPKRKR